MNPTKGDMFVDKPLTIVSIGQFQNPNNFIARRVFPNIPVTEVSASYQKWDRGSFLRAQMRRRAPGAPTAGARFGTKRGPFYLAEVWGLHKDISDQDRTNSASGDWNLERGTTQFLSQQAMLMQEKEWARNYFTTGKWATDLDGVTSATPSAGQFTQWDQATSNPVATVRRYSTLMLQMTGIRPNKFIIAPFVLDTLMEHPDILDRAAATGRGSADVAMLAELFGVDEVLVPQAVENVGADGAADTVQFIMGNHALLLYAQPSPNLEVPSAGYTFSWTGYLGAGNEGQRIKKIRLEENASDRIEIEQAYDQVLIAPELGIFFETAIAA